MLRSIGISRIIWDWRDEHVHTFDAELDALRQYQIELSGIWTPSPMPAPEEHDYSSRFGVVSERIKTLITEAARRGYTPDLWTQIAFGGAGIPSTPSEQVHHTEVIRAADHLTGLVRLARGHGMCVVLTNHGGWAGEPRTLIDIVSELARRGLGNVGIGFRLQHAHHLIADLDHHIAAMSEHLVAVMLSGADAGAELTGRLILPFGAGSRDRWITHAILESGWQGRLVVHAVGNDDSEARLLDSLEGWEWAVDRFLRHPRQRPIPRILEPTWPPGASWVSRSSPAPAPTPAPMPSPPRDAAPWHEVATDQMAVAGPVSSAHVPTPYGQVAPARQEHVPLDAASYFAAAWSAARNQTLAARAAVAHAPIAQNPTAPLLPLRSPLTTTASGVPLERASLSTRPKGNPAPAHPFEGLSRRERRVIHDQHESATRQAAKIVRDQQRASAKPPERIGHREVRHFAPDPYSGALHALLLHLEKVGFTGAPRSFGWDDKGRHLVEYVAGLRADHLDAPDGALEPHRIGEFVRQMHDALDGFVPPDSARWFEGIPSPGTDLIVHQDITPSNIVLRADGSLVAIDWDAAGPGTRLWDLAYACHSFAPLYRDGADLASSSQRLRQLVDGYGLDDAQRAEMVPLLATRSQRMYEYLRRMRHTGRSPWIELWQNGVGTVWKSDAEWIQENADTWYSALMC